VAAAFERISQAAGIVVVHDAARPFASAELFSRVIRAASESGAAIAAVQSRDTVKQVAGAAAGSAMTVERTLARDRIYLAQTPQAFARRVLADAIRAGRGDGDATDEAQLAEQAGYTVSLVEGEARNIKITTEDDLRMARMFAGEREAGRIGTGYDLHRLEAGRPLIIGGVEIPHPAGLAGHSDADVLCHAVTDAILGAAAAGDIGQHFPDSDPRWEGASSVELLKAAVEIVQTAGYTIANVDAVVIAERPKLAPYIPQMRERLADALRVAPAQVSIKGKTNERIGELGRGEAIAVHAIAMVVRS
jgi:2-C-methyl-D-erythritol 4-phosphate cytidylyltransferase/2-C-methyl-D-erythritol 2,4-cyclodiphosphate synthase